VAYDVDAEGDKGAERLEQLSPRMQRIRPPVGKDVTAFWQAGGRVRDWVRFELARLSTIPGDEAVASHVARTSRDPNEQGKPRHRKACL
jgi:hypothetical protein